MIVSDHVPSLRNFRIVFIDDILFGVSVIHFPFFYSFHKNPLSNNFLRYSNPGLLMT